MTFVNDQNTEPFQGVTTIGSQFFQQYSCRRKEQLCLLRTQIVIPHMVPHFVATKLHLQFRRDAFRNRDDGKATGLRTQDGTLEVQQERRDLRTLATTGSPDNNRESIDRDRVEDFILKAQC
jgi:hypothetical protein